METTNRAQDHCPATRDWAGETVTCSLPAEHSGSHRAERGQFWSDVVTVAAPDTATTDPSSSADADGEGRSSSETFLTIRLAAGLANEVEALEVETFEADHGTYDVEDHNDVWLEGRAHFARAFRDATIHSDGARTLRLDRTATVYATDRVGVFANVDDILADQQSAGDSRERRRLGSIRAGLARHYAAATSAISRAVAREEREWQADLAAHSEDVSTEEAIAIEAYDLLRGTGSELFAANYSLDGEPGEWDGIQRGDFDDLTYEDVEATGPFRVAGAAGVAIVERLRPWTDELLCDAVSDAAPFIHEQDADALPDQNLCVHCGQFDLVVEERQDGTVDHLRGEHDAESGLPCHLCASTRDPEEAPVSTTTVPVVETVETISLEPEWPQVARFLGRGLAEQGFEPNAFGVVASFAETIGHLAQTDPAEVLAIVEELRALDANFGPDTPAGKAARIRREEGTDR